MAKDRERPVVGFSVVRATVSILALTLVACNKTENSTSKQNYELKVEGTAWLIAQASSLYWDSPCEQSSVEQFAERRTMIMKRYNKTSCPIGDQAPAIENVGNFIQRTNPNDPAPRLDVLCYKDGKYLIQLEAIATELETRCKGTT